ncbi:hypothetical protein EV186_103135 [Labedaea rhizosphaerae]|uniref:Helix-hairpin-helix protein n=1 Tax=Labedaea rhizosphaerae TaxID=598644 RepID=A0A4R6SC47_LABRH|nr:hypothetical protein EV186_103135 [Labedaea rhizosphaerae]
MVTAASAGILAWAPFVHAGGRLGWSRPVARNAVVFAAAGAVICVLISLAPTGPDGRPATGAGQVISSIGVGLAMVAIAVACLLQAPLRRRVFFGEQPKPAGPPVDPAVAAVLAARKRREEARELVRTDPMMARELHIGRPDRNGTYDDGGLVDLASAPAPVIATVCEIDEAVAQSIVDMRERGPGLHTVDDVFSLTDAPLAAWDRIRDRAVVIPG